MWLVLISMKLIIGNGTDEVFSAFWAVETNILFDYPLLEDSILQEKIEIAQPIYMKTS